PRARREPLPGAPRRGPRQGREEGPLVRAALPRDAAVTGIGCATPLGFGADASFRALLEGRLAARIVEGGRDGGAADPRLVVARVEEPWLRAAIPEDLEPQAKFLNGAG